jgi:hypothetical protein
MTVRRYSVIIRSVMVLEALLIVDKQGGYGFGVVCTQMAHASDRDEHGAGLDVPAVSQSDDFSFDTVSLLGEAESDIGY